VTDKPWKAFERRLAAVFGGQRRGAYTGANGQGRCDIIKPGWSIEAKLYSNPTFDTLLAAAKQAEKNREASTDIPVAVVKRKGGRDDNALVVMRLETFSEYFVNSGKDGDNDSNLE
jgi:hypothetical protein